MRRNCIIYLSLLLLLSLYPDKMVHILHVGVSERMLWTTNTISTLRLYVIIMNTVRFVLVSVASANMISIFYHRNLMPLIR